MRVDYQASLAEKKVLRAQKVDKIVVKIMRGETELWFDGDEKSWMRLYIIADAMQDEGVEHYRWNMADCHPTKDEIVTPVEMKQAAKAGMLAMGAVWFVQD